MKWIVLDGDYVVSAGQSKELPIVPATAIEVVTDMSVGDMRRAQMIEGELVLRPEGPAISASAPVYTVEDCEVGTVIEVHDLTGSEIAYTFTTSVAGDDVALTISEPGAYRIEVTPPLPALPSYLSVEVS